MTSSNKSSEIVKILESPICDVSQNCSDEIREYFSNGKLKKLIIVDCDGLKHISEWYENGTKSYNEYWKNGKESGHWEAWHYNGLKKHDWYWENGKEIGHWEYWYDNGTKIYNEYWGPELKRNGHIWEYWGNKKDNSKIIL